MKKVTLVWAMLGFFLLFVSANMAWADNQNIQLHITIVGNKEDVAAKSLYNAAVKLAPKDSTIEWGNVSASTPGEYPVIDKAAAYVCVTYHCSLPAFTPERLQVLIQHFVTAFGSSTIAPPSPTISSSISQEQNKMSQMLKSRNFLIIIPVFWFFGLLLSLTPCLLPLMLIMTSILGGSVETITKRKGLILALIYILALATTYAVAGMIFASFGFYVQGYMQNTWVLISFSFIFIVLGTSLFGFFNLRLPLRWRKAVSMYSRTRNSGSYVGVAMMGILATLIASPCVAAPLAGILAYIAQTGDVKLGGVALFATGVGIGTPVIIVSTLGMGLLQKAGEWQKYVKEFFGVLLLGIAIWLLERVLPAEVIMLLWAGLVIFVAVYMGALDMQVEYPIYGDATKKSLAKLLSTFTKMVSLMILVYGGALIVGALIGNTNPFAPLEHQTFTEVNNANQAEGLPGYHYVKTLEELQLALTDAKTRHEPVMLVFSSEWCTSCKEMERDVYPNGNVQILLRKFDLLYVDLTNVHAETINIANHYNVIGPPTVLFFYDEAIIPNTQIDGAVSVDKLIDQLNVILNLTSHHQGGAMQ